VEIVKMATKTVVKTAEMLSQFDEQEDARIVSATLAMDDGELAVAEAIATIAQVLGAKPSWARYSMGRIRFVETLEAQGKSEDAIKSKWKRVCRDSAITIPVSDDPEAKKKAEQRAKARAVFADKSDAELEAEMANLLAQPTLKRIEEAKKFGKELDQRQKDAGNDVKAELNAVRKDIRDCLAKCDDMDTLVEIHRTLLNALGA
jgi:hypothetical protein